MPRNKSKRRPIQKWLTRALIVASLLAPAMASAQVVVIANGSPITELDIRHRSKLMAVTDRKTPTRQEVIKELIDDRLKIAKGKVYGLIVSDAQVDEAFANMAKKQNTSPEQFAQSLARAGMSENAVKARMRAEIVWNQMIRGKFGSS
ncbi:MAG: SurA N-terminal domain-containing protein, partial [Pseudolabrys sp.]|nr:SurA N-terminal domain-containing protein [Pseudolabrys sp.]